MRKLAGGALAALSLIGLSGCATLLSGPALISMATSVIGGLANGAVLGGSVVGVIKSASDGTPHAGSDDETERRSAAAAFESGIANARYSYLYDD
jgi:hypothetical protein